MPKPVVQCQYNWPGQDKIQMRTLPTAALQDFVEVFERIRQEHVETVSDDRLLELAMRGMLSGLDAYSAYLSQVGYDQLGR